MSTSVTTTVRGSTHGFTLGALRELTAAAKGMPDETHVTLAVDRGYGPIDRGGSTLSITRHRPTPTDPKEA